MNILLHQRLLCCLLLAGGSRGALAQVVQVGGGVSSMDHTQGGSVTVRGRSYTGQAGAGTINGEFFAGAHFAREFEKSKLTLGQTQVDFDLPTDLFASGHYVTVFGAGLSLQGDASHTFLFAGAEATGYNSPFFNAAQLDHAVLLVRAQKQESENLEISGDVVIGTSVTLLQGMKWKSDSGHTVVASTVGLGAGQLYGAASFSSHHARFDLDAAYIAADGKFRRVEVKTPVSSEPVRENVQLVVRAAKRLGFTVSRQNFLTPVYQSDSNTLSSVTQITGNGQLVGVDLAATVSKSSYGGRDNLASFFSAYRSLGSRAHAQFAYLVSHPQGAEATSSTILSLDQTLTPRWTVSEVLNTSQGQTTFGMGGSFLSNLATITANYQTFYVPSRLDQPFERALILSTQFHVLGRVTLNANSFVAPDGRLLYTTGGEGLVSRALPASSGGVGRSTLDANVLRGRVLTVTGEPVMGAAVRIDQMIVYTDSRGQFVTRERKARVHTIEVLGEQFLDGGVFRVVTAPLLARSGTAPGQEILILVERQHRQAGRKVGP